MRQCEVENVKNCIWQILVNDIFVCGPGTPDKDGRLQPCHYVPGCGYERRLSKDDYCDDSGKPDLARLKDEI
jgi:hypothetical protein